MKLAGTVSSVFHDYRVSRTREGLFIEVLDYHAGPLTLTREDLARFGFVPASSKRRSETADDRRRPRQDPEPRP